MLADWAGDRDRQRPPVPRRAGARGDELERAIRGLETTTEISRALGGVTELGPGARAGGQALARADRRARGRDRAARRRGVRDRRRGRRGRERRPGRAAAGRGLVGRGGPPHRPRAALRRDPAAHVRRPRAGRADGDRHADAVPPAVPWASSWCSTGTAGSRSARRTSGCCRRSRPAPPRRSRRRRRRATRRCGAAIEASEARTGALGARAARRDAAAAGRPARPAGRRAAQRRPRAHRRGARRRDRA